MDLFRKLKTSQPAAVLPKLASALSILCNRLGDLRRTSEALAVNEESVQLYGELTRSSHPAFVPELALALHNLSNQLDDVGRHTEALATIEESARLSRQLAADLPDAFLPTLAMSLFTLSCLLSRAGRREDARSASQESLELYRNLTRDRPTTLKFKEGLALSLNNLSVLLAVDDSEGALGVLIEAASVLEELYAVNPSAHRVDLANTYSNRFGVLLKLGRYTEALAVKELAAKLFGELAVILPARYEPILRENLDIIERLRAILASLAQSTGNPAATEGLS